MSRLVRHADYDVLHPSDVHPRGRATFSQLARAYNLTIPQAEGLASTNEPHCHAHAELCYLSKRTQASMLRRSPYLVVQIGETGLYPTPLGREVARALRKARERDYALEMLARWFAHPDAPPEEPTR